MILFDLNHFDSIPQYTTFPIIFMASQSFHFSILSVALNFGYNIEFDTIWKYISKTTHFWLKLSILEENHHVKFWFVSLSNLMCPLENHRNFRVQYFPQWQSRNSRYGSPKFVSHRECDPYKSLTEKIFFILMEHDAWDRKCHFKSLQAPHSAANEIFNLARWDIRNFKFWNKECIQLKNFRLKTSFKA